MWKSKLEAENEDLRNHIHELENQLYDMTIDRDYYMDDADHTMEMYQELRERATHFRWYERILRRVFT